MRTTPAAIRTAWVVAAALCLVGCPTYEDEYTGRYQEAELDEFQDQAIGLDLFRFGGEMRAIIRYYDIASSIARDAPFDDSNEVYCRWSHLDHFDEQNLSFSLTVPSSSEWEQLDLEGRIDEDGMIELEIDDNGGGEPRELMLEPGEGDADADCATIDDFLIRAIFDDTGDNGLDPEVYQMNSPVFSLLWVGVEQVGHLWVPLNHPEPSVRLDDEGMFVDNGLVGSLSLSVPPPPDRMLVDSGETRYGLAHLVAIDDSESEGSFSWQVGEEPVVATALEDGRPEDAPQRADGEEIERWGKALLFVEGQLDELGENLRRRLVGIDEAEQGRHFYIVDVFSYYRDEVDIIRLPPRPQDNQPVQRRVSVNVTDDHLDAGDVPVPRLLPLN